MADNRLTLADFFKAMDPDGTQAAAVNLMEQFNPVLQDAPVFPSNAPLGNRTTYTRALPAVGTAKINRGVIRSKSARDQRTDAIGYFAGRSEIDARLRKTLGTNAYLIRRRDEDRNFEEALTQLMINTFFYGSTAIDEASFDGLAPRMAALNQGADAAASQVWSNGTVTGGDGCSIYVVDWGESTNFLMYPMSGEGGAGGLEIEDKGEQNVNDTDGNPFFADVSTYDWFVGLCNKDPRRIARLANIDLSDALTDAPTQGKLLDKLEQMFARMPTPPRGTNAVGRRVLYCPTALWAGFAKQARTSIAGSTLTMEEYLGQPTPHFWGNPIRQVDQLVTNESTVS